MCRSSARTRSTSRLAALASLGCALAHLPVQAGSARRAPDTLLAAKGASSADAKALDALASWDAPLVAEARKGGVRAWVQLLLAAEKELPSDDVRLRDARDLVVARLHKARQKAEGRKLPASSAAFRAAELSLTKADPLGAEWAPVREQLAALARTLADVSVTGSVPSAPRGGPRDLETVLRQAWKRSLVVAASTGKAKPNAVVLSLGVPLVRVEALPVRRDEGAGQRPAETRAWRLEGRRELLALDPKYGRLAMNCALDSTLSEEWKGGGKPTWKDEGAVTRVAEEALDKKTEAAMVKLVDWFVAPRLVGRVAATRDAVEARMLNYFFNPEPQPSFWQALLADAP